jgi:hypothetical protein
MGNKSGNVKPSQKQLKAVDDFSNELYNVGPKLIAVRQIMTNQNGKEAFVNFLENVNLEDNLQFLQVNDILKI